jgi:uncharacterized membrane protein
MNENYITSDIGIASLLTALDFKIEKIERENNKRCQFHFLGDLKQFEELAKSYWNYSTQVDAHKFYDSMKNLKNRIYGLDRK